MEVFVVVNQYGTKVIQSGNVIEVYEYKNPVKTGFTGGKGGRKKGDIKSENTEENREKVLSRARRDLRRIVNANLEKYSKFLTLTFADDVQDISYANNEFKKFIKRFNYYLGYKVAYSGVIEFQNGKEYIKNGVKCKGIGRGTVHYHVIFYNTPQKLNFDVMTDIWGNGWIFLNVIDNVDNVGAYMCKYMTKCEDEKRLRGKKLYFNSRGLKKPQEVKEPELVKAVVSALQGQAPKYENTFVNEYNSIAYKQYIIE